MYYNRDAFTMIELIFVIVIIGILAAIAIPKLVATRDDAFNAKDCKNISTCVTDLAAEYTAKMTITKGDSIACTRAENSVNNNITISVGSASATVSGAPSRCGYLNTSKSFGGSRVSI